MKYDFQSPRHWLAGERARSDLYLLHQIFYTNLCQVLVNLLAKINDSDVFFCKSLRFWVRNNTTENISVDFRLRQEKSSQLAEGIYSHRLRDLSLNFTLGTSLILYVRSKKSYFTCLGYFSTLGSSHMWARSNLFFKFVLLKIIH